MSGVVSEGPSVAYSTGGGTQSSGALLFNPIQAADDELAFTLVGQEPLLEELRAALLADAARGASIRHWLLVAPRGSGKSHVSELLARRMRREDGWKVVRFPEEAYRVSSVADLLATVVGRLEGTPRPFEKEADPARIEDLSLGRLERWRTENGPVLVILENLGEILERRFNRKGQARLRAILMGDPPFTLVATATRMFGAIRDHGAPFYDFFQERRLEELTLLQVVELVERRASYDRATELLENPAELRVRVAALYHLSGGNPRLVVDLYRVLREGLTTGIYQQLRRLLDDLTPYYQHRLKDASPQGTRVLAEMAMAEGPLVPTEIGRRCHLKTNQVTAILSEMAEERLVKPGGRPVDKRSRYWEVADRLFRIWLQMREEEEPRGTLRWIVEFYRGWYRGSEALDPAAVLAAWTQPDGETSLPLVLPLPSDIRLGFISFYTTLRDLHLLPHELPPYSDAARVLEQPDREAALAALHPELREAVQLLIGEDQA